MATDRMSIRKARRESSRRAFSLLELIAVVAIVGFLAAAAAMRFGEATLNTTDSEGYVRRLVLDLRTARRATIATGDDHLVRFNRDSAGVVSHDLIRVASGGDMALQPATAVPAGTTITTGADDWRYDFSGALSSAGASSTIQVDSARFAWTVTLHQATGAVRTERVAQP